MSYIKELDSNRGKYGSLPFWSWNDRLEPTEMIKQIRNMHELGMKGFFMHARGGLITDYLSDEWFSAVKECTAEAKKLGMEAWAYDENGWPSGFAGGELLKDAKNLAAYLSCETKKEFDPEALGVYIIEGNSSRKVEVSEGEKDYICVYRHYDSTYVDTLDGDITRKFIAATHEEYRKRLGDDFGKAMPGFFTDEPQYFRWATVWSDTLPRLFSEKYGYSVYSALDALFFDFEGAREFRFDYWQLCHKLFIDNFIKVIYDWCNEHGCRLTGHAVEETFFGGQMWCCGGVMPFYEYEHIPGIDHLGRGLGNGVSPKQIGSVAAQLGKEKVLSEMFACCGWDVSPKELKKIAEYQFVAGVNLICEHLYPYSERGGRKYDYPAHYSKHLPWQKKFADFETFFDRLGYTLSRGRELAPVLVIHPIHSAWLDYKRKEDQATVSALDDNFTALTDRLYTSGIGFHYGDEELMAKYGSVKGGKLIIGRQEYSCVVLPLVYSLDSATVALLREYVAQGGRLLLTEGAPDRIDGRKAEKDLEFLKSNTTLEAVAEELEVRLLTPHKGLKLMSRQTENGLLVYAVNLSGENISSITLAVKGAHSLNTLDLAEAVFRTADTETSSNETVIKLSLEDGESTLITSFAAEELLPAVKKGERIVFDKPFIPASVPENAFTVDRAELSYNGTDFEKSRPIELIRDILYKNRYAGRLWLKYSFEVNTIPDSLSAAIEPMNLEEIYVNGKKINPDGSGWFDPSFVTVKLASELKTGHNEITVKINYFQRDYVYYVLFGGVTESLRNCLVFDTEIERIYLFGRFKTAVDKAAFTPSVRSATLYNGAFAITKDDGKVDMADIVGSGYPFFAGSMDFENTLVYKKGDPTELYLNGRYSIAEVKVNGESAGNIGYKNHLNLSGYLKEGKNTVSIRLYNSNRNLMGPFHRSDPEPYALGPPTFSYELQWKGEECPDYLDRYAFINFGAEA